MLCPKDGAVETHCVPFHFSVFFFAHWLQRMVAQVLGGLDLVAQVLGSLDGMRGIIS